MASTLASSFIGWSILPNFATKQLLPFYHKFYKDVLHREVPAPDTPLYKRHYRLVYAFVVVGYLLYNFREAALAMPPNYYEILGVSPSSDDSALKNAFRQFAKKNHPDRVGPDGEALFMEVRDAFEALKNPITRFAYDRFGPDALKWTRCTTTREYIRQGLSQSSGFHIVTLIVLILYTAIGGPSLVAFWQYLLFISLFAYELLYIMSPSPSAPIDTKIPISLFFAPSGGLFRYLWPNRVAYQHIKFFHSLFTMLTLAVMKVSPVLFPSLPQLSNDQLVGELNKINAMAMAANAEVSTMVQLDLYSCHGESTGLPLTGASFAKHKAYTSAPDSIVASLTTEMENMFIENKLLNEDEPMKSAVEAAIEKREHKISISSPAPSSSIFSSFSFSSSSRGPSTPAPRGALGLLERRSFGLGSPLTISNPPAEGYIRARSQSL
ncbi:hypothetical protein C8Q75DRAFT_712352 [Abortiporus biennis]|nr:hypothetical protein C8Q75DRAFT_712352 [Abortiporus biennis]